VSDCQDVPEHILAKKGHISTLIEPEEGEHSYGFGIDHLDDVTQEHETDRKESADSVPVFDMEDVEQLDMIPLKEKQTYHENGDGTLDETDEDGEPVITPHPKMGIPSISIEEHQ